VEFALLAGLIMLGIPIMAVVALVKVMNAREEIRGLERRLAAVEGRIAAAPPSPAPAAAPVAPVVTPAPQAVAKESTREAVSEPEKPAASVPPSRPAQPEAPKPAGPGFEERFGTRWTVWVGGIALALGGIFLVRYSIEQGLLGPGVRIALGLLLAAALVAGGEWARRQENLSGVAGLPSAHIPGILTAAGTTVAYATAYAAYALYDFLAPGVAFVLLGIIALATLAAALLHGPALAGLGLIGAYVSPALAATDEPNFLALYLYLAVVTAAAFALARMRMWRWLAITAVVASLVWLFIGIDASWNQSIAPHAFFAAAGFVLAAVLIVSGFLFGPEPVPGNVERVSSVSIAAYVMGAAALVVARDQELVALFTFAALVLGTVYVAWRAEAASGAVLIVASLSALVMGDWAVNADFGNLVAPPGPVAGAVPGPASAEFGLQMIYGFGFAALFGVAGFFAQGRSIKPAAPIIWAASAVLAPLAILIALYYRISGFDRSVPFAALALLLAALYGVATELMTKREVRPGSASAAAIFAVGAIASLALALTMALEKGWLTIALALMVPGIAYVAEKRPLPALRWLAALLCMAVAARVAWEPRVVGADVGTTPIFNWLLWGYGVPALAFWTGGYLLRRRADDAPAHIADSLAILFTVLLLGLQIRHYVTGGNIYAQSTTLGEIALQVCAGLATAIGLERLRVRTGSVVHDIGALVVAGGTLALIFGGLLLAHNPMFTREPVGGAFFNLILLGYGIPAVLAIVLALTAQTTRPMSYRAIATVTAVILALAYLTLQVRTLFRGPVLSAGSGSDAEQYAYSAVWLAFGVVLLLAGILLGSKPARLASAAVVALTIAKVFLVDMSDLQGVYRALSFIGLGLVLVGIGWLYQRLLFPAGRTPPGAPPPAT
jgi:uncharacterized membrane protein